MHIAARVGLGLAVVAALTAGLGVWALHQVLSGLPPVASLRHYRPPVVTTVWSRDGVLMAEFAEERRKVVEVADLPDHVVLAFLAAEDSKFFRHEGLDWRGILRAALANVREGRIVQGGSTITQQVAKSLLLSPERSFRRKIREAVLAVRIERNLTKPEILRLYLNQIFLGHGAYGVEAAAEVYFGTSARHLDLAQAALLAGLPQAPSRYNPQQRPHLALERRQYVLNRLLEEGWVSPEEAEAAAAEPLALSGARNPYATRSPHFSEQVRRLLEARYGTAALQREGLRVVASMDARLQEAGQRALRQGIEALDRSRGYRGPFDRLEPPAEGPFAEGGAPAAPGRTLALVRRVNPSGATVLVGGEEIPLPADAMSWALPRGRTPPEVLRPGDVVLCDLEVSAHGALSARLAQEPEVDGALVALDPRTGEVLACIGGYDFSKSQFNRALQAQRQAGSAIKPLIYAAAVERGFGPSTLVYDAPVVYDSPDREDKWKPRNYTEAFYGATTLREALVHSRNVVTVKVLRDIGVPYAVSFLQRLGIRSPISPDLSLALGASTVTPLELASVYGAFATGGIRREPTFLLRVEDRDGTPLESFSPPEGERTLRPETAYVLTHMMQAVIQEGTGRQARGLPRPAAGKTGTTNDNRDAWFLGYTPDLVTAVWIGYDDSRSLGRGETGGRAAAPIWLDFMRAAVAGRAPAEFGVPEGVEFARVDAETGFLAGPSTSKSFTAAFVRGSVPPPPPRGEAAPSSLPFDPSDPRSLDVLR
ncbi:MAG: PBP1A family penicillin-binding protein [Deferrisomatales bacterium]|nr:PBP1A family penicillin-binding protein [Deferrisomatales bacterium]